MTAADYAAMFRHAVLRLRADGVTKAITVMNYMGFVPWAQTPWFSQLWPGNDVVDWIGIDTYGSGNSTGYYAGNFNTLVDRTGAGFPGYYNWAVTAHPGVPIMVAEWGIEESTTNPGGKASYFNSVAQDIGNYPQIHAMVYFDQPTVPGHQVKDTAPDSSPQSLTAFTNLGDDPRFTVPAFHYSGSGITFGS